VSQWIYKHDVYENGERQSTHNGPCHCKTCTHIRTLPRQQQPAWLFNGKTANACGIGMPDDLKRVFAPANTWLTVKGYVLFCSAPVWRWWPEP